MAGQNYLQLQNNVPTSVAGVQTSVGVGSAGQLLALNASGLVDISALPTTAVTPGSYTTTNLTVDQYGRITAASNGISGVNPFLLMGA